MDTMSKEHGEPKPPSSTPGEVERLVDAFGDAAYRYGISQVGAAAMRREAGLEAVAARTALLSHISTAGRVEAPAPDEAAQLSPTPDGVIKERGSDGRRPDGPGLSHSVSSPSVSPAAAASIPGAGAVAGLCEDLINFARLHERLLDRPNEAGEAAQVASEIEETVAAILSALNVNAALEDAAKVAECWRCETHDDSPRHIRERTERQDKVAKEIAAAIRARMKHDQSPNS